MSTDEAGDEARSRRSGSSSGGSRSSVTRGSRSSARRRVGGARDRHVFGGLSEALVSCQDGLVCTPVDSERSECQPENQNGMSMCM